MKSTGLAFKSRDYIGSAQPPATVLEDESRFGSDGAFKGDGEPDWVQLPSGLWVMSFDGSNDYVSIPDAPSLSNVFSGGATLKAWVSVVSDGGNSTGAILAKMAAPTAFRWGFRTTGESAGKAKLDFYIVHVTQAGNWETTATEVTLNVWTCVILTHNSDDVANNPTIYVNDQVHTVGSGLTEVTAPIGAVRSDSGGTTLVGNREQYDFTFDGLIALPRVYNRVLSAAEIAAIYQAERHWFGV